MSATNDRSSHERQIRQLLEDRLKAIHAKDAAAAIASSTQDILLFDLAPPLQHRGLDVNRKGLEDWFRTFTGPVGYELRDVGTAVGDEVAFAHGLARISGDRTDGTHTDVWVRMTVCFRKIAGKWMIAHEHVSVPFEMAPPFKAALGLEP
jgi:ketosteroid isomerase-like protein